jgi:hypothetical protein
MAIWMLVEGWKGAAPMHSDYLVRIQTGVFRPF